MAYRPATDSKDNIQNKPDQSQKKTGENDIEVQFQVDTDEKLLMNRDFEAAEYRFYNLKRETAAAGGAKAPVSEMAAPTNDSIQNKAVDIQEKVIKNS